MSQALQARKQPGPRGGSTNPAQKATRVEEPPHVLAPRGGASREKRIKKKQLKAAWQRKRGHASFPAPKQALPEAEAVEEEEGERAMGSWGRDSSFLHMAPASCPAPAAPAPPPRSHPRCV